MFDLIKQAHSSSNPAATTKSFALQECEAISRNAKCAYLERMGHAWMSLQHDGVVACAAQDHTVTEITYGAEKASTQALGFTQKVESKNMEYIKEITKTNKRSKYMTWIDKIHE